jgi:hypothetical protein
MSYSSIGTSFSHNNGMEGEVMGSRPPLNVCVNYQKKNEARIHPNKKIEKKKKKNTNSRI